MAAPLPFSTKKVVLKLEHSKENSYAMHVKWKQKLYFLEQFSMNMICLCYEKIKIGISSCMKKRKKYLPLVMEIHQTSEWQSEGGILTSLTKGHYRSQRKWRKSTAQVCSPKQQNRIHASVREEIAGNAVQELSKG